MSKKHTSKKKNYKNLSQADIRVRELPNDLLVDVSATPDGLLYCITIDGEYLRSPNGTLIVHEDERAMRELAAEIDFLDELDVTHISLYNLCSTKADFVDRNKEPFDRNSLIMPLLNDPVLKPCAGPEYTEQMKYLRIVVDFLAKNGLKYPNLPQIPYEFDETGEFVFDGPVQEILALEEFINNSVMFLNDWQHTVFVMVAYSYNSPVLGVMLAKKMISPNEFAVTYYTALAVNSKIFGHTDREQERALVEFCTKQAECMIRFMDRFGPASTIASKLNEVEEIIRRGESLKVEFKSTLRWNLKAQQQDHRMEHAVLKSIVAFLNTDGGTLLVGIEDNGNVLGIDVDGFPNEDKYLLHFTNLLNDKIGRQFSDFIKYETKAAEGKKVLLVECARSQKPVFLKTKDGEEFYIRTGPSSQQLLPSEILEYSKTRFS